MYKVKYEKLAYVGNEVGNISQGFDIAYMDCSITEIESRLKSYLGAGKTIYYPVISSAEKMDGHLA